MELNLATEKIRLKGQIPGTKQRQEILKCMQKTVRCAVDAEHWALEQFTFLLLVDVTLI
jgi:hypothetical protein